jgi:hypothetical protein
MRRISGRASSYIERVVSPSGIRKPLNSVDDDPRPVPNSKRPSERWSSIATRSAVRAGWFTGGVMFQIAEPTCSRFVRAGDPRQHDLGRRDVGVLLEEVVLDRPDVLEVPGVDGDRQVGLAHQPGVLRADRGPLRVGDAGRALG